MSKALPDTRRGQLALPLHLGEQFSFANFHSDGNEESVRLLSAGAPSAETDAWATRVTYLWGARGTGKTHLLQAACREAAAQAQLVAYVSFDPQMAPANPAIFTGLGHYGLVCIDAMDASSPADEWQLAMIDLYHRLEEQGGRLVLSGRCPVAELPCKADLRSRLSAGISLRLQQLSDEARTQVLQARASSRGFELNNEVAMFILRRFPRDMHALLRIVELLDRHSLADQRRVTIPYIRQLLGQSGP